MAFSMDISKCALLILVKHIEVDGAREQEIDLCEEFGINEQNKTSFKRFINGSILGASVKGFSLVNTAKDRAMYIQINVSNLLNAIKILNISIEKYGSTSNITKAYSRDIIQI